MIEVRNLKLYEDSKAVKLNLFERMNQVGEILGASLLNHIDDENKYRVNILFKSIPDKVGLFDTFEKAEAFYNALVALLPDSPDKKAVIDHKDYEWTWNIHNSI